MNKSIESSSPQNQSHEENSSAENYDEESNSVLLKSVKEGLKRWGNSSVDQILAEFSSTAIGEFLKLWISFIAVKLSTADKWCYEMRKKGNGPAFLSYFLSKALYRQNPEKEMNVFAWCGVSALKVLHSLPEGERKGDYDLWESKIIKELISLPIRGKSGYDQVLLNQIRSYRIKILGTEKDLLTAFEEQKKYYLDNPEEDKRLRLLGWILHDCIKQASEKLKSEKLVKFFSDELRQLSYPDFVKEKDPNLFACYEKDLEKAESFLSGVSQVWDLFAEEKYEEALALALKFQKERPDDQSLQLVLADIHSKLSHHKEAMLQYLSCLKRKPEDPTLQTDVAWAVYKFVNACVQAAADKPLDAKTQALCENCLNCLDKLSFLERPSKVYSLLLKSLTRFVHLTGKEISPNLATKYLQFVQKWGWNNLTDEDFQGAISKNDPQIRFPSLAQNLATTLYHAVTARNPMTGHDFSADFPFVLDYFRFAVERYPDDQWMPYHYGKLLIEKGEYEIARDLIIKIAQKRMDQFWVWNVLAETFPKDSGKQMVCYCRALCCNKGKQEEHFFVSVHEKLGDILREKGMNPEACCEYLHVDQLRAGNKWHPVRRRFNFQTWSKDLVAPKSNQKLYESYAEQAEGIVLDQLPNFDGVILDRYTDKRWGREMMKVWWKDPCQTEGQMLSLTVRKPFHQSPLGTPVRLWVKRSGKKVSISKLVPRKDGALWDLYPRTIGILATHDEQRGRSWFLSELGDVSADWKKFPQLKKCTVGGFFDLGIIVERGNWKSVCFYTSAPMPDPLPSYVKKFSGPISIPGGRSFGFVGEAFLPESILSGRTAGETVTVLAVLSFNRSKSCDAWKVVRILDS